MYIFLLICQWFYGRIILKSMQSETWHIAPSLFYIYDKMEMEKYIYQRWLLRRGIFMKGKNNEEANMHVPALHAV